MAKQNKSKVRKPETPTSALLQALQQAQAILELDEDGTILHANEIFLKPLGYALEEIRGKPYTILRPEEHRPNEEYEQLWEKLKRGESESGAFRCVGKNDKEVWFSGSHLPLLGTNGRLARVVMVGLDTTATHAEQRVRTEIMNLTSIVSEANLRGDIIALNEKFIQVSKYSREELLGKPHNTTRHPDMPKEVFREMWATIGRGKIFRGVVKNRAKDGTPYYVDAVIAPILGENGKPKKYLGVRYDITEMEIERQNMRGLFRAIEGSFGYIEFDTSGNILTYNKNIQ